MECNFNNQSLPTETALGVLWNIEEDVFTLKVNMKEKTKTRRGMLPTLISVYDALGFVAPFILQGRRILQHLCEENLQCDEIVHNLFKITGKNGKEISSNCLELRSKGV